MEKVILKLDDDGHGEFLIMEGREKLARMEIEVSADILTVRHTYVVPKAEGRGIAKRLLGAMIDYVRRNKLKVVPICPFVRGQFKRHPEEYADVWHKELPKNSLKDRDDPWIYT